MKYVWLCKYCAGGDLTIKPTECGAYKEGYCFDMGRDKIKCNAKRYRLTLDMPKRRG